ncbi:MAG: T6SS effector amidase Tae4 family protein [Myxococcota bacterium]
MNRLFTNFDLMWSAYPARRGPAEEARAVIGGNADSDWLENTCVLRISRCCNYAGHLIPGSQPRLKTVAGGDGMRYAFRVGEFRAYLRRTYGEPSVRHVYPRPDGDVIPGEDVPLAVRGRQGLIVFLVEKWLDATGHIDLWDGEQCAHHDYFKEADEVELWEVPDLVPGARVPRGQPSLPIAASVGAGAQNRASDVVIVRTLLAENGRSDGRIDGLCSPQVIEWIRDFQNKTSNLVDGRVDPNGATWRHLNGL